MYFIKRIHSSIETFLDFCLNKSKLRIGLIKVSSKMLEKDNYILKMLRKMCKNYLWKNSLKVTKLQPSFLKKKKHFQGYIARTTLTF